MEKRQKEERETIKERRESHNFGFSKNLTSHAILEKKNEKLKTLKKM